MMASEATSEKTITIQAPASPTTVLSNDVPSPAEVLNGSRSSDEVLVTNTPGTSSESDPPSTTAQDGTDKGHARTASSIKKPVSFKAVSVNKKFLASKVSSNGSSYTAKPGEKPAGTLGVSSVQAASLTLTTSSTLSSRPRLVAKPGPGNPLSRSLSGAKPAAAPDPSVVWNKNRPPPVVDAKTMTDDELRKKFGIHMASRLHTDDTKGGAANWADEDEDDEWVPDTISWADGTKTTLPHNDEPPAQSPATSTSTPAAVLPPMASEAHVAPVAASSTSTATKEEAISQARSAASSNTPSPSIKPGLLASGHKGLILKSGHHEKPTLVAKPAPQPTPPKSPWATLPPVEKSSPFAPGLEPHPRPGQDSHPRQSYHGARELSADDFSRSSWRDGHGGYGSAPRELFNSQSGRYEPVAERRTFQRNDVRPQPHSVLQRPPPLPHTHTHDMEGPAEPSPAFQTRTSSHDGPMERRRRGSSIVSGGSGAFGHRFGSTEHAFPHDLPMHATEAHGVRRDSFADSSHNYSPRLHSAQPEQTCASPQTAEPRHQESPATSEAKPVAAPAVNPEETFEFQRHLMRERRELAMKRRLEQEAQEEAAKRERIRVKLEAMGPAPERRSDRKDHHPKEDEHTHTQIQHKDRQEPTHPSPSTPASHAASSPVIKGSELASPRQEANTIASDIPPNGTTEADPASQPHDASNRLAVVDEKSQPWNRTPPADRFLSWGPTHPTSRIWGSPNNNRTLGNGTFSSDLGRVPDAPGAASNIPSGPSSGPGPIAPPSSAMAASGTADDTPSTRLAPIGPPHRKGQNVPSGQRPTTASAWRTPNLIQEDDSAIALETQRRNAEYFKDLESRGMTIQEAQGPIEDTWRAVEIRSDGTRSDVVKVQGVKVGAADSAKPWESDLVPRAPTTTQPKEQTLAAPPNPPIRPSRFFPSHDARHEEIMVAIASDDSRTKSPSPPPPTMDGHPAYDGDARHPHVSLPPERPVVKLPPSAIGGPASNRPGNISTTAANALSESRSRQGHTQPLKSPGQALQENWQNKINHLLGGGRKTISLAPKSIHVDSASKHALDQTAPRTSATVSFPTPVSPVSPTFSLESDESSYTTKDMDEECFEEQEMGSLPPVRLPLKVPNNAWLPSVPASRLRAPRSYRLFSSSSKDGFEFDADSPRKVFLPGMKAAKEVGGSIAPTSAPQAPTRPSRGRGGTRGQLVQGRRPPPSKPRDAPGPGTSDPSRSNNRTSRGGGGGGGFSRGADTWSRT